TVRRLTRTKRSTIGMMKIRPGPRASPTTRPRRNRTPRSYSGRMWMDARIRTITTTAAMIQPVSVSIGNLVHSCLLDHEGQSVDCHDLGRPLFQFAFLRPHRPPTPVDEGVAHRPVSGGDHNFAPHQSRDAGRRGSPPRLPHHPPRPGTGSTQ